MKRLSVVCILSLLLMGLPIQVNAEQESPVIIEVEEDETPLVGDTHAEIINHNFVTGSVLFIILVTIGSKLKNRNKA